MISVIIPIFNAEDYLHVCINSVLNQSYQDFEILCVNDASEDSSLEILEYFAKKDSRVKIIKNEKNNGPSFSRNKALNVSKGKYIFFLEAHDWISLNTFEILVEEAERNNLDLLMFKNSIMSGEALYLDMDEYSDIDFMDRFDSKVFNHKDVDKANLFKIPNGLSNKLYLKSFLDEFHIRFANERLVHEDSQFFYKCFLFARRISFIDKYLYNYRRIDDFTSNSTNERLFDDVKVIPLILNVFIENRKLYGYYKKEILSYIFSSLNSKYNQIGDDFKEKCFKEVQWVYKKFIQDYGLYNDIKESVDEDILTFFSFEELVGDLLKPIPKISVIIPVFNVEKYLKQCLDSVCNQSFKDMEIICVNDGSVDSSPEILENYAKKDNRIKIITQKHYGVGHARNTGLSHATGEYVLYVDSDDFLCENALRKLYFNAVSNDSELVIFKFFGYNENDNTYNSNGLLLDESLGDVDYNNFVFTYEDIKMHVMNEYFAAWFKLYKKEFLDKFNLSFPVGIAFEDVIFQIKSFIYAKKMSFLPEAIYSYRVSNSNSLTKSISKTWDIVEVIDSVEEFLKASSLYGYFESEFLMFKIFHLGYRVRLSEGNDYFNHVKNEFIKLNSNTKFNINNMTQKAKTIFCNVLNSNDLEEYLKKI